MQRDKTTRTNTKFVGVKQAETPGGSGWDSPVNRCVRLYYDTARDLTSQRLQGQGKQPEFSLRVLPAHTGVPD